MDYYLIFSSLISGLLLFLSFPKFGSFVFSWFCFIPLFSIILYKKLKILKLVLASVLCGVVGYGGILYWIVPTFKFAGENIIFGFLALLLLSLYCSVYLFIFCLFINSNRQNPFFCLTSSLFWIILEYIRTHIFSGFPWAVLGYSQYNNLVLIQIAEFSGVYGVSFLIIFFNLSISSFLADYFSKKRIDFNSIAKVFLSLLLIFISFFYGKIRIKEIENSKIANNLTVVILQGNIDQYKKWDKNFVEEIKNKYAYLIYSTYKNLIKEKSKDDIVLWIWPESSIPGWLFEEKDLFNWISEILKKTNIEIISYHLVGTVRMGKNFKEYFNSAVLLKYDKEIVVDYIYDKIHLVPFGEYVPFRKFLGKFVKVVNELGEFNSGEKFTIFKIRGIKFGCLICYESIFPELTKKFVNLGADFLINITNDAWFLKTSAPYQHFIFNVFRAVENRVFILRSANTGVSAIINPTGAIVKKTNLFEDNVLVCNINIPNLNKTFYTKYGEFLWIFYILSFSLMIKIKYRKN